MAGDATENPIAGHGPFPMSALAATMPPMDTALAAAALAFLEHEGRRFPDFSPCLILVPHHHAGVAFRRALAAAHPGRVLLPPRLMTLPELAASAPGAGETEADSVRLALLQHFLAKTGQVPRAALWTAAQELLALQAGLLQPSAEKAVAYGRHLYDIAASTNAEVAKVAEFQMADMQKKFMAGVDSAIKNAPAGTENAVSLVKSAMAAANNAYESVQKAAKQAADIADANFQAVTNTAVKATQGAAKGKRA